jgi:hypothetical protein
MTGRDVAVRVDDTMIVKDMVCCYQLLVDLEKRERFDVGLLAVKAAHLPKLVRHVCDSSKSLVVDRYHFSTHIGSPL